ncbi:35123_t:CDS:2, partial [Gigaspora margarita]
DIWILTILDAILHGIRSLLTENDGFLPPLTNDWDCHFLNPIHIALVRKPRIGAITDDCLPPLPYVESSRQ